MAPGSVAETIVDIARTRPSIVEPIPDQAAQDSRDRRPVPSLARFVVDLNCVHVSAFGEEQNPQMPAGRAFPHFAPAGIVNDPAGWVICDCLKLILWLVDHACSRSFERCCSMFRAPGAKTY